MTICTKRQYPHPHAAKRAGIAFLATCVRQGREKLPRAIHPCAACHAWHITSKKASKKAWQLGEGGN